MSERKSSSTPEKDAAQSSAAPIMSGKASVVCDKSVADGVPPLEDDTENGIDVFLRKVRAEGYVLSFDALCAQARSWPPGPPPLLDDDVQPKAVETDTTDVARTHAESRIPPSSTPATHGQGPDKS